MSTILKALRRLEGDAQPAGGRELRDEVVELRPGEPQPSPPNRSLWWAGGAGVLLVAIFVGTGLWLRGAETPGSVRPPAVEPASPQPLPVSIPTRDPVQLPAPALAHREADPSVPPIPAPSDRPYRLPDPRPTPAFEAPSPKPAPAPIARAEPAPAPLAPPAPAPRQLAPTPLPPAVSVERTVWHPDASRRLALVRPPGVGTALTVREGDAIGELVVLRIEPAEVVFLYRGAPLHRPVGR
ncbi:MAG: hypothetical protein ABFS46_13680 [Myxococcota bacterium]